MSDCFNRKAQSIVKNHGVIAHTPSHLPGILSFLFTGALFAAALLLTSSQELDDVRYAYAAVALRHLTLE